MEREKKNKESVIKRIMFLDWCDLHVQKFSFDSNTLSIITTINSKIHLIWSIIAIRYLPRVAFPTTFRYIRYYFTGRIE